MFHFFTSPFSFTVNITNRIILKDALLFISSLKTLPIFELFVKLWQYNIYEIDIFSNRQIMVFLGCTPVGGVYSQKWGHFLGICMRFWLAGVKQVQKLAKNLAKEQYYRYNRI